MCGELLIFFVRGYLVFKYLDLPRDLVREKVSLIDEKSWMDLFILSMSTYVKYYIDSELNARTIFYRLSSIVYRLSSIVYRLSSIVYRLSSIVYRLSSKLVVYHQKIFIDVFGNPNTSSHFYHLPSLIGKKGIIL